MSTFERPEFYREVIDALVEACHKGQGQIGANRALKGVWNENATADNIQDQHEINLFLERISEHDRKTLAGMLTHAFEHGVFESLKVLEKFAISPFDDGYEGSPQNDFIGRLDDWSWPRQET